MKKSALLLFTLISFWSNAQTLTPVPTQDTVAVWSVWSDKYVFLGDSTFNGNQYKKVFVYYADSVDTLIYDSLKYACLYRQDASAEKAYCVQRDSTSEKLLYDFSANLGDTVKISPGFISKYAIFTFQEPDGYASVRVEAIDSVLINGTYRKRIEIAPIASFGFPIEYWIEGVGSSAGIVHSALGLTQIADITANELLICMTVDGTVYYQAPPPFNNTCFEKRYVSIDENKLVDLIKIYPNPVKDKLTIQLENGLKPEELIITSITGQTISNPRFTNSEIDVSSLQKGFYILQFVVEGKIYRHKFLKD